jgi:predicted DNA-binding transcriptional regulator AlpA
MQSSVSGTDGAEQYLPSRDVCARYGISDMTLWRWQRHKRLGFPNPTRINTRKYWLLSDLTAWERRRCGMSMAEIGGAA